MDRSISPEERTYVRGLAKRQSELAADPENAEKAARWLRLNDGASQAPLVTVDEGSFYHHALRPRLHCEGALGRYIEETLVRTLIAFDTIGDDRVVPTEFRVQLQETFTWFQTPQERIVKHNDQGLALGFHDIPVIVDLPEDLKKLKPSRFACDLAEKRVLCDAVEDVIGDILPVALENRTMLWCHGITSHVVRLMGMEHYYFAMHDTPEALHALMRFITDELIAYARWQEAEGLLTPNWDNHYAGSCSFGFTERLPTRIRASADLRKGKTDIKLADLWLNTNSQETVGISRDMFMEFALPYYREICALFGAVYYGCCEPVHELVGGCLDTIPNLRKLSCSNWCDPVKLADLIRGKGIVLSRKPAATFLGSDAVFQPETLREYITETINASHGVPVEFVFRDVCTLMDDPSRLKRAVFIVRECAKAWRP